MSSKSERNLIILQVNINWLRNKLEELQLLIHDTHADIITIQETKLTPKAKTPKIHNFTSVRTDRLHKAGGWLITLIRDNITFTTTDIPSTINTHNIELQIFIYYYNIALQKVKLWFRIIHKNIDWYFAKNYETWMYQCAKYYYFNFSTIYFVFDI